MRECFILALLVAPAFCQIADIATNSDGSILLFKSRFRLQTELDLNSQQKIYRWRGAEWSRLAIEPPTTGRIPGGIFEPFVIGDGGIYGWQVLPSRGLFSPVQIFARAELYGITLPENFPLGSLKISANGRFVTAGTPVTAPQLFDSKTGSRITLPLDARLVEVASNGSVLYLEGAEAASALTLREFNGATRRFPAPGSVTAVRLSENGLWIGVESMKDSRHTLRVFTAALDEALEPIEITPSPRGRAYWGLSNDSVVYFDRGDAGINSRLVSRNLYSAQDRTLAEAPEPFAEVALSADGLRAWTVSENNRLWRLDIATGAHIEVAPPLGHAGEGSPSATRGSRVPGSAFLLPGKFTRGQQVTVDGDPWPISDVNADGLWVQAPWEWTGSSVDFGRQTLLIRSPGNPFEDVTTVAYDGDYRPSFATQFGGGTPSGFTIVAAHQDFRGVVTQADPALPGETIHVYMTGLGALEQKLPTGAPGPIEALRPLRGIDCVGGRIGLDGVPLSIPNVVFAGGMIGFYQVEILIPPDVPDGLWAIRCGEPRREAVGYLFTRPN